MCSYRKGSPLESVRILRDNVDICTDGNPPVEISYGISENLELPVAQRIVSHTHWMHPST